MTKTPFEIVAEAYNKGMPLRSCITPESLAQIFTCTLTAFKESPEVVTMLCGAVKQIPLNISSTRRSGENGLRNTDELCQAFLDALIAYAKEG